jgi:glyoxylase-like metal-dependent hydrolase (beta-lactamase superfamily II)
MVDPGGAFGLVPRVLYERYHPVQENGGVVQMLTCLLVKSEGSIVLVDTGLGPKLSEGAVERWHLERPGGGLLSQLQKLGVEPETVDHVINTHLHSDHCGGNTFLEGEHVHPTFPNATYWVQRMEWADGMHPDARTRGTYFWNNFGSLMRDKKMALLTGEERISKHLRCVVTPGHTRGHQSVILESGDWTGMFVSDVATYGIQFARTAWVTAYDVEPLENIRTKQIWQRWAVETNAWLFFIHDPMIPVGRLLEREGKLELEPVEQAGELIGSLPTPLRTHG